VTRRRTRGNLRRLTHDDRARRAAHNIRTGRTPDPPSAALRHGALIACVRARLEEARLELDRERTRGAALRVRMLQRVLSRIDPREEPDLA